MQHRRMKSRREKGVNRWYPAGKATVNFSENPVYTTAISPHAGFEFSGKVSLNALANIKKNRVWIFGTSHFEDIQNGLSVYNGNYHSSIGQAEFPKDFNETELKILEKYFSDEGHRTSEHSIENVLFCLNHYKENVEAICGLVRINEEMMFEKISDDIAKLWKNGDSIVISTDWNHFIPVNLIDKLMNGVSYLLYTGDISGLYNLCRKGVYEACGIDSLYLAAKVLNKIGSGINFKVLDATDSSKRMIEAGYDKSPKTCVGYIAAIN
jgi:AmmeMemoRadiSam system protein B